MECKCIGASSRFQLQKIINQQFGNGFKLISVTIDHQEYDKYVAWLVKED